MSQSDSPFPERNRRSGDDPSVHHDGESEPSRAPSGPDAGFAALGVDPDGKEPSDQRRRRVFRAIQKVRRAEEALKEARHELRQAEADLRAHVKRQEEQRQLGLLRQLDDLGVKADVLEQLVRIAKQGNTDPAALLAALADRTKGS